MFQVQRATSGVNPTWKRISSHADETKALEDFQKQLTLNCTGRFRLVNPGGEVIDEAKALPLFQRSARDDEERLPTCFTPTEPTLKEG